MLVPLSYNIRSLFVRKATTIATALGVALVVFVLAASLMLANGVQKTLGRSGSPDVALVMSKGADAELSSNIDQGHVALLKALAPIRSRQGSPDAVAEIVGVLAIDKVGTAGGLVNVAVRGVEESVLAFRPTVRVIEGHAPRPGTDEAMIGRAIRGRAAGVELGQSFEIRKNRKLRVVGVFEDGGSSFESEVWTDVENVRQAFSRQGLASSLRARLRSESAFDEFKRLVESDRRLGLTAVRETTYYEQQSQGTSIFLMAMGILITFFFSFGAIIGAMITMYAAVANRSREIGTLRALGFSKGAILFSFLFEAIVLAGIGGVVGVLASLGLGAVEFSVTNFSSFSELVFRFEPAPGILLIALMAGSFMGLVGGFFPAVRAARVDILQALRG